MANRNGTHASQADFSYRNEGSLILLTPVSRAGHEWADNFISNEGYQPWLPTRIIETRYFPEIAEAIVEAGLVLG